MLRTRVYVSVGSLMTMLAVGPVVAQQGAPATLSSSLGVWVFPAKNQSATTQSNDEAACFGWAKGQTGIDPMAITPQTSAPAASAQAPSAGGTVAKGAVGGALLGTAVGAIAGNAGKGAAIGAGVGLLGGAAKNAGNQQQAEAQNAQAQAATQQQAQASIAQQKATYNKAFSACMEAKGYTVK